MSPNHAELERTGALPPGGWAASADTTSTIALTQRVMALQAWAARCEPWQATQAIALAEAATALLRDRAEGGPAQCRQVFDEITSSNPGSGFPWAEVQPTPRGLAFLYQFAPWADTGAVVASKRLRERGQVVDVISCSAAHRRRIDPTIASISAPYVGRLIHLDLDQAWASWPAVRNYAVRATQEAESMGGSRTHLYTRAMWVPPHYAGAYYKTRHPAVPWIAEFSDPLSIDVEGRRRTGPTVPREDWFEAVWSEVEARYGTIPETERGFFSFAEWITYALADELVFTNENQRDLMLSSIEHPDLRADALGRSRVSHHPVLPHSFYDLVDNEYVVDASKLNLAYFGDFYATRGISDITSAIKLLPDELRKQVNLHVFTSFVPAGQGGSRPAYLSQAAYDDLVQRAMAGVGGAGLESQIHLNPALPYLDFLNITRRFDYLIVSDARTAGHHEVNPYLPSKFSDYANSTAGTWALVEEGSILSRAAAAITTPVGDVPAALEALTAELLKGQGCA